jgi:AcrR family transcriptional regulator
VVGTGSPLRADARRNRDQIVAAATRVFADAGPDVPMEDLARRAGVGVGTLYRRFPDREALVLAVVRDSMAVLLAETTAAAAEPRAWDGLVRSLRFSPQLKLTLQLGSLFPAATVAAVRADPEVARIRDRFAEILDGLVRSAQAEGSLRPDVTTEDVTHLFELLLRGRQATDPDRSDEHAFDRARAIALDGLRAGAETLPPHRPAG